MPVAITDLGEHITPYADSGSNGRQHQSDRDPTQAIRGMPPAGGDYVLPHAVTYQGIFSSVSRVYRISDEALKSSLENARYMLNDPVITDPVEMRQRMVALLDWHLEPEDKRDPTQKWLCERMTAILKATPHFMKYRESLSRRIWFGRYGCQHRFQWKPIQGQMRVTIGEWKPVHGDKLVFRYDDGSQEYDPNQVGIRVGAGYMQGQTVAKRWRVEGIRKVEPTDYGMAYFLAPWERSLISIAKHSIEDGEYEDPQSAGKLHGVGIRSKIFWCWYQKQELQAQLFEFLERSATGIELWFYPWGNKAARDTVKAAAEERMGENRNVLLVPRPEDGAGAYGYDRIEPSMAGAEQMKSIIVELFNHQIKRYVLGQTMTTEAANSGLGSNLGEIHLDTLLQIIKYDAIGLSEDMTAETVLPLLGFNFPKYRQVPIRLMIDTESEDAAQKLEALKSAHEMGLEIKKQSVYDTIGESKPEPTDEILPANNVQQGPGGMPEIPGGQPGEQPPKRAQVFGGLGGEGGDGEGGDDPQAAELAEALGQEEQAQQDRQQQSYAADGGDASEITDEAIERGTDHEMEHTTDRAKARKIAMDHLKERPDYYAVIERALAARPPSENSERKRVAKYSLADMRESIATAAAETDTNPTDDEKQAGNYRKGRCSIQGLEITIENPKGSIRSGKGWSVEMRSHYGYIRKTESEADGDHVDVFLGPHPDSEVVFVIDQTKAPTFSRFDEHKCMVGYKSAEAAKAAYLESYTPGWRGFADITPMTMDQFKTWLKKGDTGRRAADQVTEKYAKVGESQSDDADGEWPDRDSLAEARKIVSPSLFGEIVGEIGRLDFAPSPERYAKWDESAHPRGQPENAGEFAAQEVHSDNVHMKHTDHAQAVNKLADSLIASKTTKEESAFKRAKQLGIPRETVRDALAMAKQVLSGRLVGHFAANRERDKQSQAEWDEYKSRHPTFYFVAHDTGGDSTIREALSVAAETVAKTPGWRTEAATPESAYFVHESTGVRVRIADHAAHYPRSMNKVRAFIDPERAPWLREGDIAGRVSRILEEVAGAANKELSNSGHTQE